jgi:hypothetical protein
MVFVLEKNLKENYKIGCTVHNALGKFMSIPSVTSVYVDCPEFIVQFAVLHSRGDFLWIGEDKLDFGYKKIFGDVNRALNKYVP